MAKRQTRPAEKTGPTWTIIRDGEAVDVPLEEAIPWVRDHSPTSMVELERRIRDKLKKIGAAIDENERRHRGKTPPT